TTHKPFPRVTGSFACSNIRYRLLTSPLCVYACHCPDCQKKTGSAFGLFLSIETSCMQIILTAQPELVTRSKRYACPKCNTTLWMSKRLGGVVLDVRVGTLDFPGLMEPDVHAFVKSRVAWVGLPDGARKVKGGFDFRDVWPRASLRRLDKCLGEGRGEEDKVEGEKTPTAGEVEDDEAFERRAGEIERVLAERLVRLGKKLG
ncbi:hypothetical protein EJ02DRAFT_296307, partial [Clathrospora elynae]